MNHRGRISGQVLAIFLIIFCFFVFQERSRESLKITLYELDLLKGKQIIKIKFYLNFNKNSLFVKDPLKGKIFPFFEITLTEIQ